MMRKYSIIAALSLAVALVGCNKDGGASGGRASAAAIAPAGTITVTSAGKPVETYTFKYDADGRVTSLVRKDEIAGRELLNLTYKYDGSSSVIASGTMDGKSGTSTLKMNLSSGEVSWESDAVNPWRYTTRISNGVASKTETISDFNSNAGYYKSSTTWCESYKLEGKDIVSSEAGAVIESRAEKAIFGEGKNGLKPVTMNSRSSLVTTYKYSSDVDRQNFNSFLFGGSFPVWYAEGLPGCEHLVTDITMANGSVAMPITQHLDYSLNSDGDIQTVTRTYSSDGKEYLVLKYVFDYNSIN